MVDDSQLEQKNFYYANTNDSSILSVPFSYPYMNYALTANLEQSAMNNRSQELLITNDEIMRANNRIKHEQCNNKTAQMAIKQKTMPQQIKSSPLLFSRKFSICVLGVVECHKKLQFLHMLEFGIVPQVCPILLGPLNSMKINVKFNKKKDSDVEENETLSSSSPSPHSRSNDCENAFLEISDITQIVKLSNQKILADKLKQANLLLLLYTNASRAGLSDLTKVCFKTGEISIDKCIRVELSESSPVISKSSTLVSSNSPPQQQHNITITTDSKLSQSSKINLTDNSLEAVKHCINIPPDAKHAKKQRKQVLRFLLEKLYKQ